MIALDPTKIRDCVFVPEPVPRADYDALLALLREARESITDMLELYECHWSSGCECDTSVDLECPACSARRSVNRIDAKLPKEPQP